MFIEIDNDVSETATKRQRMSDGVELEVCDLPAGIDEDTTAITSAVCIQPPSNSPFISEDDEDEPIFDADASSGQLQSLDGLKGRARTSAMQYHANGKPKSAWFHDQVRKESQLEGSPLHGFDFTSPDNGSFKQVAGLCLDARAFQLTNTIGMRVEQAGIGLTKHDVEETLMTPNMQTFDFLKKLNQTISLGDAMRKDTNAVFGCALVHQVDILSDTAIEHKESVIDESKSNINAAKLSLNSIQISLNANPFPEQQQVLSNMMVETQQRIDEWEAKVDKNQRELVQTKSANLILKSINHLACEDRKMKLGGSKVVSCIRNTSNIHEFHNAIVDYLISSNFVQQLEALVITCKNMKKI